MVAHLVRDQEVAGSSPVIQTQQAWRPFRRHAFLNSTGELSEWLKEPASKTGVRVTVPGVRIPHSPQPRMASQRSCGAFLLSGRCKLACIRQDSKKAPAGRRPGMPFQVARAPRRASRECAAPRASTIPPPLCHNAHSILSAHYARASKGGAYFFLLYSLLLCSGSSADAPFWGHRLTCPTHLTIT